MPCLIGRMENWNDWKGEEDRMDKTKAAALLLFLFVKFILLVKKETFPVLVLVNFSRSEICVVMYMYDGLDRKFCSFFFFFFLLLNQKILLLPKSNATYECYILVEARNLVRYYFPTKFCSCWNQIPPNECKFCRLKYCQW